MKKSKRQKRAGIFGMVCLILEGAVFCLLAAPAYPQEATPTPGTPAEWSEWLNEQEDVTVDQTGEFDPVNTYAGSYAVPRLFIKQSLSANVAVEIELGYSEAISPIDPSKIGGLRCQGETVTEMVEPVIRLGAGPKPTPIHPGPHPRPTPDPDLRPHPGGTDSQGRRITDVIISDREIPGAVRREARRVSGVRLIEPVESPPAVERVPWHSSYAVRQGPVWLKVEVEE